MASSNNINSRKKLDEYHTKVLRELVALPCNKNCFDCNQRGPTYVNVTIGSFVCTKCSGILRGLTPPQRVKSISMTTFTLEEVEMLKSRGNDYCRRVWLGLSDNSIQYKDEQQIKDFMIDKYEKKRYYIDPSTLPNLKPPSSQPSSQPPLTSISQPPPQVSYPKSIPLRTTQITHTNGSSTPTSNSTSSSQSNSFPADFQLAPKDPFSSSNGTNSHLPRSSIQLAPKDPFSSSNGTNSHLPRSSRSQPQQQISNFADFDTAVFSSVQPGIAAMSEPNRKPMTAPLEIPKEDKYAALKDLDSIMKQQQQMSPTPTTLDNQNINGDISSSKGWNSSGGAFGSPSTTNQMFPNNGAVFGASPKMNGFNNSTANGFNSPANGFGNSFVNGSVFSASSNSSMFGSPSTNGSLFGSPGGRSSDSPVISNGTMTGDVANPFSNAANPFRSDVAWLSQPGSNGTIVNGGFPSSHSLDFSAGKVQWPMVNNHIANPFKMNTATPQTTAPHHSSNPFL